MIEAPKAPTKYQLSAIEEKVRAYTNMLSETLGGMNLSDTNASFVAMLNLITLDLKSYDQETKELLIGEVDGQEDLLLRIQIQSLLPEKIDKDDLETVYTILYKLFHEYRLNKSPDCSFADDHNAAIIAQGGNQIYAQTYQKTGTLAARCLKDGEHLSDEAIENIVLSILRNLKEEAKKLIKPVILSRAPAASSEKKKLRKSIASEQDPSEESNEKKRDRDAQAIVPLFKKGKVAAGTWYQEQVDRDFAQRLQQEEDDADVALKLQRNYF